tara:strand:- start:2768 stop:3016 length:249 start_codon:yes stop_codon:yes gene_type:complete
VFVSAERLLTMQYIILDHMSEHALAGTVPLAGCQTCDAVMLEVTSLPCVIGSEARAELLEGIVSDLALASGAVQNQDNENTQ